VCKGDKKNKLRKRETAPRNFWGEGKKGLKKEKRGYSGAQLMLKKTREPRKRNTTLKKKKQCGGVGSASKAMDRTRVG